MMNSIIFSALPDQTPNPNQSPNNSFISIVKLLIDKSNFTKGQVFYLVLTVIYLSFILLITTTPTIISVVIALKGGNPGKIEPPIPIKDLVSGLKVWFLIGSVYFVLYAIPELRDRWNTRRKNNN